MKDSNNIVNDKDYRRIVETFFCNNSSLADLFFVLYDYTLEIDCESVFKFDNECIGICGTNESYYFQIIKFREDYYIKFPHNEGATFYQEKDKKRYFYDCIIAAELMKDNKPVINTKEEIKCDREEQLLNYIEALKAEVNPNTGEIIKNGVVCDDTFKEIIHIAEKAIKRKIIRKERTPINSGKKWTVEETTQLLEEHKNGLSIAEIAKLHERSTLAIMRRLLDNLNL